MRKAMIVACVLAGCGAREAKAQSRGLYWRLDTGYAWASDANLRDKEPGTAAGTFICGGPLPAACSTPPGELDDIGQAWIAGVGVGYRFTPRFRADVTISYRSGFRLDDVDKAPSSYTADIRSFNVMVNGYLDFPLSRTKAVLPYVGAGVGYASNRIDNITNVNLPPLTPGASTVPGGTKTGVAWQLSFGMGIVATGRLTLDVGYRYLDSGRIETSSGDVTGAFAGPYPGATGNLRAHELQVGVRF